MARTLNGSRPYGGGEFIRGAPTPNAGLLAVYIAAPTTQLAFVGRLAKAILEVQGLTVCSRWDVRARQLAEAHSAPGAAAEAWKDPALRAEVYRENMREMRAADQFVVVTSRDTPRATYSEAGWAQAAGRPTTFIASSHVDAGIFADWDAARIVEDTAHHTNRPPVDEAELFARVVLSIKDFARRYP